MKLKYMMKLNNTIRVMIRYFISSIAFYTVLFFSIISGSAQTPSNYIIKNNSDAFLIVRNPLLTAIVVESSKQQKELKPDESDQFYSRWGTSLFSCYSIELDNIKLLWEIKDADYVGPSRLYLSHEATYCVLFHEIINSPKLTKATPFLKIYKEGKLVKNLLLGELINVEHFIGRIQLINATFCSWFNC